MEQNSRRTPSKNYLTKHLRKKKNTKQGHNINTVELLAIPKLGNLKWPTKNFKKKFIVKHLSKGLFFILSIITS